jgi:hypothetical protein
MLLSQYFSSGGRDNQINEHFSNYEGPSSSHPVVRVINMQCVSDEPLVILGQVHVPSGILYIFHILPLLPLTNNRTEPHRSDVIHN